MTATATVKSSRQVTPWQRRSTSSRLHTHTRFIATGRLVRWTRRLPTAIQKVQLAKMRSKYVAHAGVVAHAEPLCRAIAGPRQPMAPQRSAGAARPRQRTMGATSARGRRLLAHCPPDWRQMCAAARHSAAGVGSAALQLRATHFARYISAILAEQ